MKRHSTHPGFTIVELLVVIAIIGVLATIVGLNYANATKTARLSQAKSNANAVEKVAESFYADKNRVPGLISDFSTNPLARVPDGVTILTGGQQLNGSNGQSSVDYDYVGDKSAATGGRILYWDFEKGAVTDSPLYVGTADGSTTNWTSL